MTKSNSIISVERAERDLRAGIAVNITCGAHRLMVASAETCPDVKEFDRAVISAEMSVYLGLKAEPHLFTISDYTACLTDFKTAPWQKDLAAVPADLREIANAAIKLHKISSLLPIALISSKTADSTTLSCTASDIANYGDNLRASYSLTSEANVPLHDIGTVRVLSFRPRHGGLEQLAIITGDISSMESVPVRLHSSCLTGDILGSMRCDCGEQLQKALKDSAASGGGVVLYLNQEGRGIGITNKLRAYEIQDSGSDTYDANLMLGYAEDERDFSIAAAILKSLGIRRIKLMTNNPEKIRQMEQNGIEVEKRLSHSIEPNGVNDAYLASKKRHGHIT